MVSCMSDLLVHLSGVRKAFGAALVLDDITLDETIGYFKGRGATFRTMRELPQ